MKRIEHLLFLKRNQLEIPLLLQPIQEKIEIFNRMQQLLDTVSDCEKGNLLTELEALDLEILEDIEEEYADKLTFNEIEEEITKSEVIEEKVDSPKNKILVPKTKKLSPDEIILKELLEKGTTTNISRSEFKKRGLQTPLGWDTTIGKYRIIRTEVFRYRYDII